MTKFLDLAGLVALWNKIKNTFIGWADTANATTISIDSTPTSNSTNLVTSGGVYDSIPKDYEIDYSKHYLTIVSLEDNNTIGWKVNNTNLLKTISVSTDSGKTWTSFESSTAGTTLATLNTGGELWIKGSNSAYGNNSRYNYFTSTGNFNVEGNIMSLLFGDNFIGQTVLDSVGYNFRNLFYNCAKLISAKNFILPAMILTQYCYFCIFQNCTSLTEVPELSATTLANHCYGAMFEGCTTLTITPELSAITLAQYCYQYMFKGCVSLITAPELPATILAEYCYQYMFLDCTSLKYIKCLATNMSASGCTSGWVSGVNSSGTFILSPGVTWYTGISSIPPGWTKYYDIFSGSYNDLSNKPNLSLYRIPIIDLTNNNNSD